MKDATPEEWNNIPIPVRDCIVSLVAFCERVIPVVNSADNAINASLHAIPSIRDFFDLYCKTLKQAASERIVKLSEALDSTSSIVQKMSENNRSYF